MIDLHIYKSPKDGRTCAMVTAATSDDHRAHFYHSGFGIDPGDAYEYAKQLHHIIDQEIVVTGDKSLLDDCNFKPFIREQ